MLSSPRIESTASSTTKTLLYTISFIFLFLFMEYSLNYISSTSSLFGNIRNSTKRNYEKYKEYDKYDKYENSKQSLSSETSFASLSSSLIEKEKLLIEKEEKYVVALQKLNERDLKLNYVDKQLNKLQSLLNKYKTHTKDLQSKLETLQNQFNNSIIEKKDIDNYKHNKKKEVLVVQGYSDADIQLLLDETRKDLLHSETHAQNNKLNNIKIEEENDKIINLLNEDEYILSNKKSLLQSNTQIVDFRLIFDLGIVLIAATFGGIIASITSQPLILGYLLGGSLVGPGGLKLIQQYIQVETLAHIGSIFLLFNVGMQFKYEKISKYLYLSILALLLCCAMLYIICYMWFYFISNENTFNLINVTIFSFAALNTSTTIVLKTWTDLYSNNTPRGRGGGRAHDAYDRFENKESRKIIVAILLCQDIFFIFFMAVFSSVTQQRANENFIYKLLMVAIIFLIVFKSLPHALSYLRKLISIDIYILFTVSLCIIFTVITQNVFESSGLGAFTAGLMISKSNHSDASNSSTDSDKLLKKNWIPIRNIFGVLFFASIGMLINPSFLLTNCLSMCSLVLFVGFGKFVMTYLSLYLLHNNKNKNNNENNNIEKQNDYNYLSLNVSTSLCLQGEFAFVLSAHAHFDNLISMSMHTVLLGSTAISILITPFVIRHYTAWGLYGDKHQSKSFKT